ncbi:2-keto-4-pentenoate hydratase [Verminephrobacter eiseniae]|uniref:fumarylacetoacetate hydrolase family protein n=1 Tax=Verminephrobacter eiseniae TaxID=364317 RepID=UPI0022388D65|nr:fumarylacetoacetate hydrolase family protein [Verminephrobacter eiseniae]MCW5259556.1 2-keto-4-pentenoate hydratase [Verminephrobacter eiseniae]
MNHDRHPCPPPLGSSALAVVTSLVAARRSGRPASALAQAVCSDDEAYAIQDAVASALGWFGDSPPKYWKSGGAARDMALTHAGLPPAGVRTAGQSLADLRWQQPAVEAEIALRLAREVTPEQAQRLSHADGPGLVDAMAVAIEIADSRWQEGLQAPAALRLADQGSHGALVLGPWMRCRAQDWARQRCELRFGVAPPVSANTGAYSLGDPLWLLPIWLRHATRGGRTVAAHSVVTTGSWVGAIPMPANAEVLVRFPGLGHVGLRAGRVEAALYEPD